MMKVSFWMNLLYLEQNTLPSYSSFGSASKMVCVSSDLYCLALFYEFGFIGKLVFMLLCFASLLQILDLFYMFRYVFMSAEKEKRKL